MKRWLVFGLIGLAVLVLLSPGIVGRIAERSIEQQLELAAARDPAASVSTERFRRGWFTSDGRHRVPLNDPALALLPAFLVAAETGDAVALIITTRLDHGLVPVGGARRDVASLVPALARGVSTVEVELADGRLLPLPGELESTVGLTGASTLTYALPPGEARQASLLAAWRELSVTLTSSADGRDLAVDARFDGLTIADGSQELQVDGLTLSVDAGLTGYGFATGDARLALGDGHVGEGDERIAWASLDIEATSAEDGGRVVAELSLQAADLDTLAGRFSGRLDLAARDIDALRLAPVLRQLQQGAAATLAQPDGDTALRMLLSRGGQLAVPGLSIATPQGTMQGRFEVTLRSSDRVASWPGIALGAEARAKLDVPRALAMPGGLFADALRPLVAGGFLLPDGDVLRLDASYAKGAATVNGAPLPLPMLTGDGPAAR